VLEVVQPPHSAHDIADAHDEAGARLVRDRGRKPSMHRHRLRRVFDAAQRGKLGSGAQRVVGITVRATDAADRRVAPALDFVEQAHPADVRDHRRDLGLADLRLA
jgi:hypothetical protein